VAAVELEMRAPVVIEVPRFPRARVMALLALRSEFPLVLVVLLVQATQGVEASLNAAVGWHCLHSTLTGAPSSGKRVRPWSKRMSFHVRSLWQLSHLLPSWPLCLSSFRWQATQVLASLSRR